MSASREKRSRKGTQEDILNKQAAAAMEQKAKKKKNLLTGIAVTLAVVLIIGGIVLMNGPFFMQRTVAVTTGSHEITPVEVRYHYLDTFHTMVNSTYGDLLISTYGEGTEIQGQPMDQNGTTWGDYIMEEALESIRTTYAFYDKLTAEGYVLSEDGVSTVESALSTIDLYAQMYGMTTDDYIRSVYGKGSSRESYAAYQTVVATVNEYQVSVADGFEFTEADLTAAYEEAPEDYQFYTYRSYLVSAETRDENGNKLEGEALEQAMSAAREKAESMAAASANNEEVYLQNCSEFSGNASHLDGKLSMRANVNQTNMSIGIRDWVTDPSRQEGDTAAIEYEGNGYYVVYWISSNTADYDAWNVRAIVITASATDESGNSVIDWDAAKSRADDLMAEVEAAEDLRAAMNDLALKYTDFEETAYNGGLYEAVYQGRFEEPVNDWIFAEGRQVGDYELIQAEGAYFFIYMDENIGNYRNYLISSNLEVKAYDSWYNEVIANAVLEENSGMERVIKTLNVPSSNTSY